jgi:hypothetical protein
MIWSGQDLYTYFESSEHITNTDTNKQKDTNQEGKKMQIETNNDFNFKAGRPRRYGEYGIRRVYLRSQSTDKSLTLKINKTNFPAFAFSNFDKAKKKFSIVLTVPDETKVELAEFTELLCDTAFICREDWFPNNASVSRAEIKERMVPLWRESKTLKYDGSPWPATMRVQVGKECNVDSSAARTECTEVCLDIGTVYITQDQNWGVKMRLDSFNAEHTEQKSPKRAHSYAQTPNAPQKKQRQNVSNNDSLPILPPLVLPTLKRETTGIGECYGCINNRPSQRDHQGDGGCCAEALDYS